MKRILLFSALFFLVYFSKAQYISESGARQAAMAGAGVAYSDIWSSHHNQAGLADINNITAGIFYSNLYNLDAFKEMSFAVASPIDKYGSAGLNYTYSGDASSNFTKFGLAFSRRLGKRITAGIQIDYLRNMQLNYGSTGVAVGEFGVIAEPYDNLFIAAHVFNPWRAKFSNSNETLSSILKLGAAYKFSDKVLFTIEGEKNISELIIVRAGTEYNIIENLYLRAGVASNPSKYSFGIGYVFKGVGLDVSYISHNTVGYFMQFGLSYTFKKHRVETKEAKQDIEN